MDKIVALCKRRGFVFQSSEIYGGLASTYDYCHYGVLLRQNVKNEWWRGMGHERDASGALAPTYDYGHSGAMLRQNVKNEWWRAMVYERDAIVALDAAVIMHPRV